MVVPIRLAASQVPAAAWASGHSGMPARRPSRPGGRLVAVDLLPHDRDDFRRQMGQQSPGLAPAQLEAWLTEAGFDQTRIRPLPPEHDAKGPALFLAAAHRI